jgi:hypothetical protein
VTATPKSETLLRVQCYAGYRGDERPRSFVLGGRTFEVSEVEDKWYSPGATFFRVRTPDQDRYLLRHDDAQDVWSLEGYSAKR